MRGVVSMAAVLALPRTIDGGGPFPQRDLLVFLTFSVILVTLVGQGLTLGPLIRRLGVVEPPERVEEETAHARARLARAALGAIERLAESGDVQDIDTAPLRKRYEDRLARFGADVGGDRTHPAGDHARERARLQRELVDVQRDELYRLRDEEGLAPPIVAELEGYLDMEDLRLRP